MTDARIHLSNPPIRRAANLRPDLGAILCDGIAWAVMVGIGESFFPAFVLAIGGGEVAAGLVATVPLVLGSIVQLLSPWGLRRAGSHRRWIVIVASIQASMFLPLILAAATGRLPIWSVFAAITIYGAAGQAGGPAWTTWVGAIVPRRIRARYFGRRNRANYGGVLAGVLAGGAILAAGAEAGRGASVFIALFGTALLSRAVSAWYLSRYSEPASLTPRDHHHLPVRSAIARLFRKGDSRVLLYMLTIQFAAMIGGPFFTPYMIRHVGFQPQLYTLWLAVSILAKMAALPILGALAHRYGARAVLWIAGVGIVPLSVIMPISDNAGYQLLIQALGGVAWAAYELSTFLLLIERLPDRERTSLLTTFNLLNSAAIAAGSLTGGAILHALGEDRHAYAVVFFLSGGLRLLTLGVLATIGRGPPTPPRSSDAITETSFRPGSVGGPVETGVVAE